MARTGRVKERFAQNTRGFDGAQRRPPAHCLNFTLRDQPLNLTQINLIAPTGLPSRPDCSHAENPESGRQRCELRFASVIDGDSPNLKL